LLSWFETHTDGNYQLLLAPFNEVNQKPGPILKLVKSANDRCNAQEVIRLLYVACTRAKQHLHLLGSVKHAVNGDINNPAGSSLLATLWPIIEMEFSRVDPGAPQPDDEDIIETEQVVPQLQRLPVDWQAPVMNIYQSGEPLVDDVTDVPSIDYLWASTAARDIGTVVHAQLQRLASDPSAQELQQLQNLPQIATCQLRSLGMPESELKRATEKVCKAISNTLDDDRGKWILDATHQQARSEWALTALTDDGVKSVVIDRTFIDDSGTRWIIDFKTGDHSGGSLDEFLDQEQERYSDQLSGYADIISKIGRYPVRMGLYFPLLKAFREIPVDSPTTSVTPDQPSAQPEQDHQPVQSDMFSSD
jgi:ATP-dependent exoDNAse (exonuclease V) beta subunit